VGFLGYCRLQKANALFKLATPAAGSGTSCRLYIIDYEHTSLLFPPSVLPLFFSEHSPMAGYVAWAAMMMDSTTMITTKNLRTLALAWPLS